MYRWLLSVLHSVFRRPRGRPEPAARPLLKRRLSDRTPATDEIQAKRPRLDYLFHRVKKSIWDITNLFGTPVHLSPRCPEASGCNGAHTGSSPREVLPKRSSSKLTKSGPSRDVLTSGNKTRNGASKHSNKVSRDHRRHVMPSFRVFRERRERSIRGCCSDLKKDAMETVSLLSLQTTTDRVTESWGPVRVMRNEKRHFKAKTEEKKSEQKLENESGKGQSQTSSESDLSEEVSARLRLGNGNTAMFKRRHSGPEMKEQQASGKEKEKSSEEFAELTEDMEKEINSALGCGPQDEILSSAFKLRITRGDIQTLKNYHWLNDEIINFYMNLLVERNKKQGLPRLHAFSTFFYPKLNAGGYQSVRRWTKGVDLFEQDIILVPIHRRVHWSLVVIDVRKKAVRYLDSMGQKSHRICNLMLQYLQEESKAKRNRELIPAEWSLESAKPYEIPQQSNGSDCGMFTCKYADYLSQDKPITFTQNQMPHFRKRMVWEILHQQLL
ncbi:sentrin-specific protease 2 isoform X3 [Sarcophilus harrisii]|uniref:sentrin-specific protease 2 isoform X3 n=1 Tax=Sarcophilus harrisii TaxID=9305 RepID=UPI001301C870|nr:sentrin-specific protease 2 isoform X3 [Sarcophilus harrisii]